MGRERSSRGLKSVLSGGIPKGKGRPFHGGTKACTLHTGKAVESICGGRGPLSQETKQLQPVGRRQRRTLSLLMGENEEARIRSLSLTVRPRDGDRGEKNRWGEHSTLLRGQNSDKTKNSPSRNLGKKVKGAEV